MVAAVRRGQSLRAVARQFGVGVATVAHWVERAKGRRLDRIDWSDLSSLPHRTRRTDSSVEDLVLQARRELAHSDLGAVGADAIRQALLAQGVTAVPSVRTINRILGRRGALDRRHRTRRPAPPRGWYLPAVAAAQAELDSIDIVEGLVIKDGPQVEVLNAVSLHGGLVASWPVEAPVTSARTLTALVAHWREVGLPGYAQFDNDMIFQGTHRYPDALGRVLRLCLSLEVVPVLVPPRETGFQAMIESYNGWWQTKVWSRFQHDNLEDLQGPAGSPR
jgi:transposase